MLSILNIVVSATEGKQDKANGYPNDHEEDDTDLRFDFGVRKSRGRRTAGCLTDNSYDQSSQRKEKESSKDEWVERSVRFSIDRIIAGSRGGIVSFCSFIE